MVKADAADGGGPGRRVRSATWLAALVTALSVPVGSPASAACAGPGVLVDPEVAAPGTEVTVTGERFLGGDGRCDDTDSDPAGCSSEIDRPRPPLTGLHLVLDTAQGRHVLAVVDADEAGAFSARVRLPGDVEPGAATIEVPGVAGAGEAQVVIGPHPGDGEGGPATTR